MVSGKYSAVSGAVAREQALSNLAANLANLSSPGFKKDRISFAAMLQGAKQTGQTEGVNYARVRTITPDLSQGAMETTGRPLDVAIDGPGFFKVQKNNETFYTRAGSLQLDANGLVTTSEGLTVLGASDAPVQIDTTQGQHIAIAETGDIAVDGSTTGARLQIYGVDDPNKLIKVGKTLYRLNGGSDLPANESRVLQGYLESANVNMMEEMTAMIAAQRAFEAHTKVIESYSRIGEKQDELGSVG
jgi:flagellar basal-body rod protein FlgF/flagellar basal-body rod protein FlgG